MTRLAILVLTAALVTACGGGNARSGQPSRLPREVARMLAARSDELAATLERGDACAAVQQAAGLGRSARELVSAGRVPLVFRAPLLDSVKGIARSLPRCSPPEENDDEAGRGKHKGKGKGKGRGKHGGKD